MAQRRLLEVLAACDQPLAVNVQRQVVPRVQDRPETAVAADGLMEVVAQSRRLRGGDLVEPAVDSPLIGEASAQSGLQGGVGPQNAVARCDALESGGQSGHQRGDTLLGTVGGAASAGVAQGQLHPGVRQAERIRFAEDSFGQHDAETDASPWYG